MPTEELDISEGETLTVSGWGLDSEGGELLEDMKQIEIPFVSDGTCAYRYGSDNYVSKVMICAGGEGGKDPCMGDTGGPLTLGDDVHVGIVSWSYGCGRPFYPSVYAQTDALIDWIQEELRN